MDRSRGDGGVFGSTGPGSGLTILLCTFCVCGPSCFVGSDVRTVHSVGTRPLVTATAGAYLAWRIAAKRPAPPSKATRVFY